jgi:cytochrome c
VNAARAAHTPQPLRIWRARSRSGNIDESREIENEEIAMNGTSMTRTRRCATFASAALLLGALAAPARAALDNSSGAAMMQKDGCAACHAVDKKILGPAYQDVAAKYKGDKTAAAKLEKKVKEGGSGVWGSIPMPPNSAVPDADIKALVAWILTLKK